MKAPIYLVDAFSHGPFTGNPAGVCLLDDQPDAEWAQSVAMEMNQAETAFVWERPDGFGLKWFTPVAEVDLCGHATLATAHILFALGRVPFDKPVHFQTLSGTLTCTIHGEEISMDFPAEPATPCTPPPALLKSIQSNPVWIGSNRLDYLVELPSEEIVRSLTPDLAKISSLGSRGVLFTARSASPAQDFVSRCFFPAFGIPEDPVTGSAHCALGPYWAEKLGKDSVVGYQASRRGGYVTIDVRGSRVTLKGRATTTLEGTLHG